MRCCRRRCRREDVPSHRLHHGVFPYRVHAHGVRQLLRQPCSRREAHQPRAVRHCRPGGLRPPAPAELPPDGRVPRVLQRDEPHVVRERRGEVGAGGAALLPEHAAAAGRDEGGPARQQGRAGAAAGQVQERAHRLEAGGGEGEGDRRD